MPKKPKLETVRTHRFVNRDGDVNIERRGWSHRPSLRDWYHWSLSMSWPTLIAIIIVGYVLINMVFGALYSWDEAGVANAHPGRFSDMFFFSVQTLSTIGYGVMSPKSFYVNCVVTAETLVGLSSIGLMTGLLFTRFSRPSARVMFTHHAVIYPFDGLPTLTFRAANRRGNQILQARVRVSLARNERTVEGEPLRRFYDLKLVRSYSSFFNLTWTVRHQIDAASPLYNATSQSLKDSETEVIVLMSGVDDAFGQPVHSRFAYNHEEILFNHRFADMFTRDGNGQPVIDYHKFEETEKMAADQGELAC